MSDASRHNDSTPAATSSSTTFESIPPELQQMKNNDTTTSTTGSTVESSSCGIFKPKVIMATSSLKLPILPILPASIPEAFNHMSDNTDTNTAMNDCSVTVTPATSSSFVFQTSPSASFVPVVVTPPTGSTDSTAITSISTSISTSTEEVEDMNDIVNGIQQEYFEPQQQNQNLPSCHSNNNIQNYYHHHHHYQYNHHNNQHPLPPPTQQQQQQLPYPTENYQRNFSYSSLSSLSSSVASPFSFVPQVQQRSSHQYIIVTLQRSVSSKDHGPWGLTVSYRNGIVLIGHVNHFNNNNNRNTTLGRIETASQQQRVGVSEYYTTKSWVSPTQFFYNPTKRKAATCPNIKTYQQYQDRFWFRNHLLQQQQVEVTNHHHHLGTSHGQLLPTDTIIQPGDCIVQIIPTTSSEQPAPSYDGNTFTSPRSSTSSSVPQYQQWDSLPSFIHTLKQSTTSVQLVLYRHPNANVTVPKIMSPSIASKATTVMTKNDGAMSSSTFEPPPQFRPTQPCDATNSAFRVICTEFPILLQRSADKTKNPSIMRSLPLPSPSSVQRKLFETTHLSSRTKIPWKNQLFKDPVSGQIGIPFDDDNYEYMTMSCHDDTKFALPPIPTDIAAWIDERKQRWRQQYRVYKFSSSTKDSAICEKFQKQHHPKQGSRKRRHYSDDESSDDCSTEHESFTCNRDFWIEQGYSSFEHWLCTRKIQWSKSYSWNQQKRSVLEQDLFGSTNIELLPITNKTDSSSDVNAVPIAVWNRWLRIRKTQWKVWRRKRQRRVSLTVPDDTDVKMMAEKSAVNEASISNNASSSHPAVQNTELMAIDAILEEQERRDRETRKVPRPPFDISFIFDSSTGCPDDIVAKIFHYLPVLEHFKFLCISRTARQKIKQRDAMWKQLIPPHWTVPRRPRKSWQELYTNNLRVETERTRKLWDDLLSKASTILLHGDQLQAIEKLINEAQSDGHRKAAKDYDINYASGVVCERNCILNLAVIHQRQSKLFMFKVIYYVS